MIPSLPQRSYIAKSGRELFLKSRLGYDQPLAQGPGEARHRVAAAPGATVSGTVLQHTWTSWGPRCFERRGSASEVLEVEAAGNGKSSLYPLALPRVVSIVFFRQNCF